MTRIASARMRSRSSLFEIELDAAGLDLRHVENVVDDVEQVLSALADVAAVFVVFVAPSGPNMPDSMISEKPMMALSGVRSSWLMLARNSDFAWLASSARVFSSAYFSASSASWRLLDLQRVLRAAQVVDRRLQLPLAVEQPLLMPLERGDVGADRDEAAVLGAPLADVQPAPVVELRLEGARRPARAARRRSSACAPPACRPTATTAS